MRLFSAGNVKKGSGLKKRSKKGQKGGGEGGGRGKTPKRAKKGLFLT